MERIFGDLMVAAGVQDISRAGDWVDFDSSDSGSDLKGLWETGERRGVDGDTESMLSGIYYSARSSLNL
jgi:hypothetical protein